MCFSQWTMHSGGDVLLDLASSKPNSRSKIICRGLKNNKVLWQLVKQYAKTYNRPLRENYTTWVITGKFRLYTENNFEVNIGN